MKKRRHHYVWRNYLKPWSTNKKIWCYREGKLFNPNIMGVGQKRDFYKVNELTDQDIYIIQKYFIDPTCQHLQRTNARWVELFSWVHNVKSGLLDNDINNEAIYNFEEDLHGVIEKNSIKYLNSILASDLSFFQTKKGCIGFSHFISVQLMRTNKVKSGVMHCMNTMKNRNPGFRIERIWNVVSHILATNMAWSIYASTVSEEPFRIVLLQNESSKEFITGDQPVVNIYNEKNFETPKDTELYYPVSPKLAILITKNKFYKNHVEIKLSAGQVKYYNRVIIQNSKNQVYASIKKTLERKKGQP